MKTWSIRLRLTLWYAAVLLVSLTLFGAGLWFALSHRLMSGVDERLAQRVEGLRTVLDIEPGMADRKLLQEELTEFAREVPDGALMMVRDAQGRAFYPFAEEHLFTLPASPLAAGYATAVRNGRRYRIRTAPVRAQGERYDLLAASPLAETDALLRDFRNVLLLTIPGLLLVAGLGGSWISRRALSPVDGMTRVARSISVEDLSARLPVPATGDELQRMSETWNGVLERLDRAVSQLRRFTADASHELRTPIALIRATAELALRRPRSVADYQQSLRSIQSEAERMTELTESLLTLARAEEGSATLPLTPLDIAALVRDVVTQNHPVAEARGVSLTSVLPGAPSLAPANEPALRRLLLGLIDNALKHTGPGGSITVSVTLTSQGLQLAVQDTGEGIPPEALPHIFERFYRADTARTTGSGVGLGLSIAQWIAKEHHSQITVESVLGSGSRFELLLPALHDAFTKSLPVSSRETP